MTDLENLESKSKLIIEKRNEMLEILKKMVEQAGVLSKSQAFNDWFMQRIETIGSMIANNPIGEFIILKAFSDYFINDTYFSANGSINLHSIKVLFNQLFNKTVPHNLTSATYLTIKAQIEKSGTTIEAEKQKEEDQKAEEIKKAVEEVLKSNADSQTNILDKVGLGDAQRKANISDTTIIVILVIVAVVITYKLSRPKKRRK